MGQPSSPKFKLLRWGGGLNRFLDENYKANTFNGGIICGRRNYGLREVWTEKKGENPPLIPQTKI